MGTLTIAEATVEVLAVIIATVATLAFTKATVVTLTITEATPEMKSIELYAFDTHGVLLGIFLLVVIIIYHIHTEGGLHGVTNILPFQGALTHTGFPQSISVVRPHVALSPFLTFPIRTFPSLSTSFNEELCLFI